MVSFSKNEIAVGDVAKNNIDKNYENTIYGVKRLIGRNFYDKEVQEDIKYFPFTTEKDKETGKPTFKVLYKQKTAYFFPEDISGFVLEEMKKIAKSHLNKEITEAVITVPAYFNDLQRKATQAAAAKAGLNVRRMINEPTAAALAYRLDKKLKNDQNVLVFDLGGGTFDVTVLNISETILDVKSTRGNMHLGGDDFDNELVQFCLDNLKEQGKDYSNNKKVLIQLKKECEKAKIDLSSQIDTDIIIDSLSNGEDFIININRSLFEELCKEHFNKLMPIVEKSIKDGKLTKDKINEIILVGGSTRMPKITEIIKKYFGKEPKKNLQEQEVVAIGAAIQGAIINKITDEGLENLILKDVIPLSLGLELSNGEMDILIPRNTKIPCKNESKYKTSVDYQKMIKLKMYQGERKLAKENKYLGQCIISNIPPKPKGSVLITVTFKIDENGSLIMSAIENSKGTKSNLEITVENAM